MMLCRLLISVFLLVSCAFGSAWAGPNTGGILVAHNAGMLVSSTDGGAGICGQGVPLTAYGAIYSRIDGAAKADPAIWKVYCVFPGASSPRLRGLTFGLTYDENAIRLPNRGACAEFETADETWPASGSGNSLVWDNTMTSQITLAYWFCGYSYAPAMVTLGPNPSQGGSFGDDSPRATLDAVAGYGRMGFDRAGYIPPLGGEPGACCNRQTGVCTMVTAEECGADLFKGAAVSCTPSPCTASGACCDPVNWWCTAKTRAGCDAVGGAFLGVETICSLQGSICFIAGACCTSCGCDITLQADCPAPGVWKGANTSCSPDPCGAALTAACCDLLTGACALTVQAACTGSKVWRCQWTSCAPDPCPQPGACCSSSNGTCTLVMQTDCGAANVWHPEWTTCAPNPCPPVGACCLPGGACGEMPSSFCGLSGGSFRGIGTSCEPYPCAPVTGACCVEETCIVTTFPGCSGWWRGVGLACSVVDCSAAILVRPNGTGDYPTIQAAICGAEPGQPIKLDDGVFVGPGNRNVDLSGKNLRISSLNGDPAGCTIDGEASGRAFLFQSGEGASCVIRGITVRNGFDGSAGGAVYCHASSPRLENCIFQNNHSGNGGGAIFLDGGSHLVLSNCTLADNSAANNAGAVRCQGATLEMIDCTVRNNTASGSAGAIHCRESSQLNLSGCYIVGNSAGSNGGAVFCEENVTATISGSTFAANSSPQFGSVLALRSSSQATVALTLMAENTGDAPVWCDGTSTVTATGCDVWGNAGGDWTNCLSGQLGQGGNISQDPRFCASFVGNYGLAADSPCAAEQNPGGQIGSCQVSCAQPIAPGMIQGVIYEDTLIPNCLPDVAEPRVASWTMRLTSSTVDRAVQTGLYGEYTFDRLLPGQYTVRAVPRENWEGVCVPGGSQEVLIWEGRSVTGVDFGYRPITKIRDMRVSLSSGRSRPGFLKNYGIRYENLGDTTAVSTLVLYLPSRAVYVSSDGGTHLENPPRVAWDLGPVRPGTIGFFWAYVLIPVDVPLGTTLHSCVNVTVERGDSNPEDNESCLDDIVTGSVDPNEKRVQPEGLIARAGSLNYHVEFQNVGTDTAFTVVVRDTLDKSLDWTSVETGGSSHSYVFTQDDSVLVWRFENIQLPDSNVNEPGSRGFLRFNVLTRGDIPLPGTIVRNQAAIYFDYNLPVMTNIVESLVPSSVDPGGEKPSAYVLEVPNPYSPSAGIKLVLPRSEMLNLGLYDVGGRRIRALWNGKADAGEREFRWDGRDDSDAPVPLGLYYLRATVGGRTLMRKVLLLR